MGPLVTKIAIQPAAAITLGSGYIHIENGRTISRRERRKAVAAPTTGSAPVTIEIVTSAVMSASSSSRQAAADATPMNATENEGNRPLGWSFAKASKKRPSAAAA